MSNKAGEPVGAGDRLSAKQVLAFALLLLAGLSISLWLVIEPPEVAPVHTSYLPSE